MSSQHIYYYIYFYKPEFGTDKFLKLIDFDYWEL